MDRSIIVLQTDFTYKEGAVASMYGVIKSVDKTIEIVDATHEIPQFDIWSASYRLMQYVRFWPKYTIFISVVDPGVGTVRKASLAVTNDSYYIISPDNGTYNHIYRTSGIKEVYEIDTEKFRLRGYGTDEVSVFHGRDIFAYTGALLAAQRIRYDEVGRIYPVNDIILFDENVSYIKDGVVYGTLEISDPNFGNVWTGIPISLFNEAGFVYGQSLIVEVKHKDKSVFFGKIYYADSFGFVKEGEMVIYMNEMRNIALAVNCGNISKEYMLGYGPDWEVSFKGE